MTAPIHLLLCEDNDDDAVLIVTRLRRDGLDVTYERVETAEAAATALRLHPPDVVISDYRMPAFTAEDALRLLHDTGLDIPFILVSGQIGDERAAALMRVGAHDFVRKDHLTRLTPVVQRELREAEGRHQRRQAQAALRESEQRFRLFAENAPDIIFRYRVVPQAEVEYFSPATAVILGYHPRELGGDPSRVFSVVDPDDRHRLEESWRSPSREPLVVRWRRPDGTVIWTEQRAVGIYDEQGGLLAVEGILRDVTAQMNGQQERERLEQQLRQVERLESLGQLAGGVAHDFNNLLAVILGHTEMALDTLPEDAPGRADLESIQQAAERAGALTRQLLIFSRLEPSQPQVLDLNAVVEETEQLLRPTLGEDIEFVILLDPALPSVRIDRSKLEQILLNVLINSRTAMPQGGRLTIETTRVNIPGTGAGSDLSVRLSISDTGCGMPPEVAKRAFEPFFTTKERGQGTGLGLSTVYGTVKDAGGRTTLASQPGSGTTIRIDLPAAGQAVPAVVHPITSLPRGGNGIVLVVEDNDDVRSLVRRMLSQSDYQVIEAASPAEALRIADAVGTRIDALLTDVVMPGMSGLELAGLIRRKRPTMPVLLMSGSLAGGVDLPARTAFLPKPFTKAALLDRLRDVVDGTA
ncbi:response regulator [Streptosporangium sp. NPDC000396]|uniref:response regulator n=1 Tax=Streptosporangium sp. NPDC000396 TaxID=3366185 RepID=UPI0036B24D2A